MLERVPLQVKFVSFLRHRFAGIYIYNHVHYKEDNANICHGKVHFAVAFLSYGNISIFKSKITEVSKLFLFSSNLRISDHLICFYIDTCNLLDAVSLMNTDRTDSDGFQNLNEIHISNLT